MAPALLATDVDDPKAVREPESDTTLTAPTLVERVNGLAHLLETDPAAAASTVAAGVTDPRTDHAWRRWLVLAAEGIRFTDAQDRDLIPALTSFIDGFRDSNDREDQIAVCSAIRTYVGLITTTHVESVAALLEPGHRASPGLETVLETIKMVARKFAANPPAACNEHPGLSAQLERVARAYLNPYVFPHGKSAAVAINAVQAVVGLASPGMHELIAEVNANCPAWFRQQLRGRLRRLLNEWEARLGDGTVDHEPTNLVKRAVDRVQVK